MLCVASICNINAKIRKIGMDSGEEFLCTDKWLKKNGICEAEAVSEVQIEELRVFANEYSLERSLKYIGFKRRTVDELSGHLKKVGIPEDIAVASIDKLIEMGFLDDEAYAEDYIREMIGKNRSTYEIKIKALSKGLKTLFIEKAMRDLKVSETETERAVRLLEKRYGRVDENSDFTKMRQYLFRKGFSIESIGESMDLINGGTNHYA